MLPGDGTILFFGNDFRVNFRTQTKQVQYCFGINEEITKQQFNFKLQNTLSYHFISYSLYHPLNYRSGVTINVTSVNTVLLISVVETVIENWMMEVKSTLTYFYWMLWFEGGESF